MLGSGLLSPSGPPGRIVDFVVHELIQLVYSGEILGEYTEVLRRPELKIPGDIVDALLAGIRRRDMVFAITAWPVAMTDRSDAVFLETAAAAKAVLVTGNLKHYPAAVRLGVEVLSPRAFVDKYDTEVAALRRKRLSEIQ